MRNRGFTIIEVMVALAIGSVLAIGAITFLASADQANRLQSALSGLSVSGRFGLDQLSRDIRMSGYRNSEWVDPYSAEDGNEQLVLVSDLRQ